MSASRPDAPCPACGSSRTETHAYRCRAKGAHFGRETNFHCCTSCGFMFAAQNAHHYDSAKDFGKGSKPGRTHLRVGTERRPGREYAMAVMAKEILDLAGTSARSILIYGPGLSLDHAHLARKYPDIRVFVSDLQNFQGHANFISLESDAQFDIVIVCEVAEHFTSPKEDFARLLSKLSPTGIVVLSTNINDGGDIRDQEYPFVPGHTAYYSGRALFSLVNAADSRLLVDFRVPRAALAQLGHQKRYVLIHRQETARGISDYFSSHLLAPSEAPYFRIGLSRKFAWVKRLLRR